jgi:hypothetical protein
MKVIGLNKAFSSNAVVLLAGLLLTASPSSAVTPLKAGPVLESRGIVSKRQLSEFPVTVHVILQIHEHPDPRRRELQELGRVAACQESIVSTVLSIAENGVPAVVAEGLNFAGTFENPAPIAVSEAPSGERMDARWILASQKNLFVYGFEVKMLNDLAGWVLKELGKSVGRAVELGRESGSTDPEASKLEVAKLVQEEVTRLNLWHAGIIPERSFLALQTALAVALARRETQVQLIIGKLHWDDFVYAVNRHPNVRLRLVPYECP